MISSHKSIKKNSVLWFRPEDEQENYRRSISKKMKILDFLSVIISFFVVGLIVLQVF